MTPEQLSKDPANLKLMWEKARKIYKELKVTGLSDIAIAGILGNMAQESSFIPNKKGGSHVGYVQNEPRIINWITLQFGGYDHKHLINYLIAGLTNKLPDITSVMGSDLNNRFNTFVKGVLKINDIPSAVKLWETSYEKSNGQLLLARINYGNYFYNKILEEGDTLKPQEYGPMYSPQGNLSIYLPTSIESEDSTYAKLTLNNIHEYLLYRQKNLPKIPYKRGYKSGGKLIKRGQQGMLIFRNPNNPYNVEIQLEKDPLPEGYIEPNNIGKYGYYDITPEERMDLTTLLLNERLSTYKPTKEQKRASEGIYHPKHITDWLGLAPVVVPAAIAAGVTLPEWGPAALATANNPLFWGELIKDTGTYIAADAASKGLTGKGIGAHVNNVIGLEEDHPVGELLGITGTSSLRRPLEKAGIAAYKGLRGAILPEYALSQAMDLALWKPYVSRVVGENGKIRLRLPSHSDKMPREIVLEPQGNNKFYVHIRTWNDIEGKVPADLTPREIGYLYESLYNELPEGAEILFPKSGPDNYATRGTVAGLQRLARDPRFSKGSSGTLLYVDKDGSIKEFTGTSFIKAPTNEGHIISYKNTVPTAPGDSWYHYGVLPTLDTYFRPLLHIQGNAAINMFKEYGGIEIPDLPIKKEIYGYVPEARVRYGLLGNTNITDDEIAQALYKQMLENNVISHEEWGPMIGFRGSTRRSNYLWPHKLPQTQVVSGGTMDNTLGTLFLAQLPHVHPRATRFPNLGVDRYLVTAKPLSSDFNSDIINMNVKSSETTGIGVTNKFPTTIPIEENFHKYLLYLLGDPKMLMYKVRPEYVSSGVNDLNAYMFRTPYLRDISNQMSVGEWDRTFDPLLKFEWLTKEKPIYIEEDGPVRATYKGHQFKMSDGGTEEGFLRQLIADLYDAIHDSAQRLQLGLYFSKRNTPFRGEHRDYLYLTLPLWNIINAKHILPYDLRLPRLWGDPNVYLKAGGKISKKNK